MGNQAAVFTLMFVIVGMVFRMLVMIVVRIRIVFMNMLNLGVMDRLIPRQLGQHPVFDEISRT